MAPAGETVGVLLAGGLARRMGGGDKPLRTLGGRPILDHVIARARPQVSALLLNVNGDPARVAGYGLPVAEDVVEGHAGPLAGILTGLEWMATAVPAARWLASFATDAPFLPLDLVARLRQAVDAEGADMACAKSAGRTHPVFALWPAAIRHELRQALVERDERKIDAFTAAYKVAEVDFPCAPVDPFYNINRPENLEEAEGLLAQAGSAS